MLVDSSRQTGKTFIAHQMHIYNQVDPAVRRRWRQQALRGRFVHAHKGKRLRKHFVGDKYE